MRRKIKLIFFHPYSAIGGADNSLYRLIKNLNTNFFDISFISLNESFLKKKLSKVNFISLNTKRTILSYFKLKKIIGNILKKKEYKKVILISNQNYANLFAYFVTIKFEKLKLIFIDRNHIDELFFSKKPWIFLKNLLIYILIKLIYPKSQKVIAISKGLADSLKKISSKSKIQLIYNPAYDKKIQILAKKRIKFKFRNNLKYIICVSRFTKRKGIEDLIQSFNKCLIKLGYLRLILIGYGSQEKEIIRLIKKNRISDKVTIINNCSNPYPYIKLSNLFVFNSKYEGFGNVLVESVALNTPVISTNCNSGPSEILLNGKGGDLVPTYNNIDILSKRILKFFLSPEALLKKNKIAKAKLKRFSIKKNVYQFQQIFETI